MTGKFLTEIDASEAGNLIAPVFASKGVLDASGYNTAGGFAYAAGSGYVRDASAWRQLMYRDGAGGADFILVSDGSGVYQAVAKSTFLSGYVTNPLGSALAAGGFKITGLADGAASGEALHYGQLGSAAVKSAVNYWTELSGNLSRASGNVAIGHTSAITTLQINKSAQVIGTTVPSGAFIVSNIANGNAAIELGVGSDIWIQSRNTGSASVYPLLLNPSGGNVGINTTATTDALTINGTINIVGVSSWFKIGGTNTFYSNPAYGTIIQQADASSSLFFRDYAGNVLTTLLPSGDFGVGVSPSAKIDIDGSARIRSLTAAGTVITDASGTLSRANHFDYSGVLTANRSMILDSFSFTIDGSGASSSPGTMLILKGKETGFTTRFLDYRNESGTTSFRMESSSTQVKLEAQNSHNLRVGGVTQTILSTGSDKNVTVHTDGWMSLHSGLSAHPSTTPNIAAKWYLNGAMYFQNATARRQFATVEDDMIGTATQVITAATHTPGAADLFVQYNANANNQTVTLGAGLAEGREYLFRCRQNSTNTVSFNADTANSFVFYEQETGSATTTSIVAGGAGGTGFKAANRIYRVRRSGTVIWFT